MTLLPALVLIVPCVALLVMELRGVRTTLSLSFRGDIKRETAFLAQYGQSVCTPICGYLVYVASGDWRWAMVVVVPVAVASITCMILKRLFGRMRPNRPGAGKFTGFAWKHDNARESFPSSHSACAFALSATLVLYWPQGYVALFVLAWVCALLRYVLDAHFPSDVLAGIVLGYSIGLLAGRAVISAMGLG